MVSCRDGVIRARDIVLVTELEEANGKGVLVTLEEYERQYTCEVLEHTGGGIRGTNGAAAVLGLKPGTLYSRMKKLGVERPSARCASQLQEDG